MVYDTASYMRFCAAPRNRMERTLRMNMTLPAHSAMMPSLAETIFVPEAAAHANTNSAFFSSSGIRRYAGLTVRFAA